MHILDLAKILRETNMENLTVWGHITTFQISEHEVKISLNFNIECCITELSFQSS